MPYVATRYVPGLSLHDHVHEEGPIEGADLTWFAACLAEGVASVHAVGVLHRDVKPSNVLMEGRTPILIDFGLARVADDPKLTHTGWLLGTPGYLAPEILYGDDATTASDVHSWAATVAYAATGRPPFGRGPSMAIMDRVRRGEHDLSGIPEPLRGLLTDALHPEPHHRPTLTEVRDLLAPLAGLTGVPAVQAEPEPESMTMPYAVAGAMVADVPTDVLPGQDDDGATRRFTEEQTVVEREWDEAWSATEVTDRRAAGRSGCGAAACCGRRPGLRGHRRGVPLVRLARPRAPHLGPAQRLAGRQRGRRPAAGAGPQVVRRRPVPAPHALGPGPLDPGHRDARRVERRARGRGGAALLRVRGHRGGHPRRVRHDLRGRGVDRAGRLAGADAAGPGGQPALPHLEAVGRRDGRDRSRVAMAIGLVARAARRPVDTRRGPSAVRTLRHDSDPTSHGYA